MASGGLLVTLRMCAMYVVCTHISLVLFVMYMYEGQRTASGLVLVCNRVPVLILLNIPEYLSWYITASLSMSHLSIGMLQLQKLTQRI